MYYVHIHMFILSFYVPIPIAALQHETGQCLMLCHRELLSSPLWVTAEEIGENPVISVYLGDTNRENTTDEAFSFELKNRDNSNIFKGVSNGVHGQIISNFPTRPSWLRFWGALNSANGKRDNSEEINILDAVNSTEKNRHSNPNNWQCKI